MKIAFNPSTVAALTAPPNNKDITFDLRGHNIFARGVKFCGTDTNTWRDIKINNVSIGSNILDLRNGSNTTLTNTNGVVIINSTWRPVVDNLTSDSTTSSLSAKQGKVLKALINGKSNSDHNHDDRYLKLTGGTMASDALITFADSGSWSTDKGPQGARGGLYWTGQSDYAKLYAEETAGDNLDLVIQFGDDNSNGLSIRNASNVQTSYISAGGVITTGTFKGNLDWSYITNKPATATRWPSWAEIVDKPSTFIPSNHTHDYLVVNSADDKSFNSAYHNFQVLYAGGGNGITGKPANVDAFGLFKFRAASGWSGQMLLANGGSLYIRSSEDAKMTNTLAWKTILDSFNYSGILDSRYYTKSEVNTKLGAYLPLTGGTMTGNLSFSNSGTGFRGINYGTMGDNDQWRIGGAATGSNSGYMEIATADDGNEPIYVRQYTGVFSSVKRTLTLLDANGYTHFPSYINIGGNENNNSSPDRVWGSNGSDSYLRSYRTSALRVAYAVNANSATTASTATALTTSAGSATLPIYFSGGKPIACTASLVFSNLSNSGNNISVTVAGQNRTLTVGYATNADKVDGYHSSNIIQAGWIGLYRTGGSASTIKWTRIGRFITTVGDNTNNDAMIEFFSNGDQTYTYFGHGRLMLSSYSTGSSNMMLTSVSDGSIHFYATIDANRYIWLGHNAWWTGSSKYRVLFTGSFVEWYSSSLTTQTTNPNDNYITDNGTFKYNVAMSTSSSGSSHSWVWQNNLRVAYATSASNADKLDGIHANGLFTALSNSNNGISITVGGTTKSISNISVNYANSAGSASSATKVIVTQHTANDTNYPLVWSNQANTNSVTENQLYKSWSDLYYNPKNKRLTVGGSVVASSFVKSGGTSQQLLRADGGIATFNWSGQSGQPTWLWGGNNQHSYYVYNPSNFRVAYATSAGSADTAQYLRSLGNQNCQTGRTQNYGDVYSYNTYDDNTGSPTAYASVIGFGRGTAGTVEIAGGWCNTHLYWRSLRDCCDDWYSWRVVLDSDNYTEFINNYYWANVKISTSSSTTTSPTVSNLTATNSIRMSNISLEHTDEINNSANGNLHLNYRSSGNVSLCSGGGKVGIGTVTPSYKLDVNGNIWCRGALNVGSTLSITDSVINCSSSNISIKSKESGSLMIGSSEAIRYDSNYISLNNNVVFLQRLGLSTIDLSFSDMVTTDDVTVLITKVTHQSMSFRFKPAIDGQLLFLKVEKIYSNIEFWCGAEDCEVVKANGFDVHISKNISRKNYFCDGLARIFIYKQLDARWYEFYCG